MQAAIKKITVGGALRQRLFGISAQATSFERRGFRGGTPEIHQRLGHVGVAFVNGYHWALEDSNPAALVPNLDTTSTEFCGFAYEGAAMGLALLDWMSPWRRHRISDFLKGAGDAHAYMVHVGAGWVLGRVPGSVEKFMNRFDPLLRWLLIDGYGFHEAFFHFPKYLKNQSIPSRLKGYARRVFDQGFGRCLWFVEGADVGRIQSTITGFPQERQGDFWSGIGLASVYAGQLSEPDLHTLRQSAGDCRPQLAQGAAFASKARLRAGNATSYTDAASRILCRVSAEEAAQYTDLALENLPANGTEPAYETWRCRLHNKFAQETLSPS